MFLSATAICRKGLVTLLDLRNKNKARGFPTYGSLLLVSGNQKFWSVSRRILQSDLEKSLDDFSDCILNGIVQRIHGQSANYLLSGITSDISALAPYLAVERYDGLSMVCSMEFGAEGLNSVALTLVMSVKSAEVGDLKHLTKLEAA